MAHRRASKAIATALAVVGLWLLGAVTLPGIAGAQPPSAQPGYATVAVRVGGDRTSPSTIGPLPGAQFGLFTDQPTIAYDGFTGYTTAPPDFTCTADSEGYCVFRVPIAPTANGLPASTRLWVAPTDGPPGVDDTRWFTNSHWATAPLSPTTANPRIQLRRVFQTPALNTNQVYISGTGTGATSFMSYPGVQTSPANTTVNFTQRIASSGVFPLSRIDPQLPAQCGRNFAVVADLSSSMVGSVTALKAALDAFTSGLQGTSSQAALFTFSTNSPAVAAGPNSPLLPLSTPGDVARFKALYSGWNDSTANGYTNWDQALDKVAQANVNETPDNKFGLVVFITDGLPTTFGTSTTPPAGSGLTSFREMETAVASANEVKRSGGTIGGDDLLTDGTRVVAVGVGSGLDAESDANLSAISGRTEYDGTNLREADFIREENFQEIGDAIHRLLLDACHSSVTVIKQIVPHGGTIADAYTPGEPWHFTASPLSQDTTVNPTSGETSIATGALNFELDHTGGEPSRVRLTENPQTEHGYTPFPVDGHNAVCINRANNNAPVPVDNVGTTGFDVSVGPEDSVTCTVYNQAPRPASDDASVIVHKRWRVTTASGTATYLEGAQPAGLESRLSLTGPGSAGPTEQQWGVERFSYFVGDHVTLSDAPHLSLPGCTFEGGTVTRDEGRARAQAVTPRNTSETVTLDSGRNSYTITNDVTCRSHLILHKRVIGGHAHPDEWTLHAFGPLGALDGPQGTNGVHKEVTHGVTYQLAESATGPHLGNYVQIDNRPRPIRHHRSTGSMDCNIAGNRPGDSQGADGSVVVPLGETVTCTATNITAPLTLIKQVDGGTAPSSDFQIEVTPEGSNPAHLSARTVTGHGAPGTTIFIRPGQRYRITEPTEAGGYKLAWVLCTVGTTSRYEHTLEIPAGERATCTVTNYTGPLPPRPPLPGGPRPPRPTPERRPHLDPARVSVAKHVDVRTARSGAIVHYTIQIRTHSLMPGRSLRVCDRLPAPLIPVRHPHGRMVNGQICWTVHKLPFGGHRRFRITAKVPRRLRASVSVTNRARLTGANIAARSASARVRLVPKHPPNPRFTG